MPDASRSRALAHRLKWVMWGNDSGEGGAFGDQPNAHPVVGDEDGARRVVPRFVAHMESLGLEVRLTALPGGALGLYEPDDKRITLSPDQSWPSLVHTAAHELAHLHDPWREGALDAGLPTSPRVLRGGGRPRGPAGVQPSRTGRG